MKVTKAAWLKMSKAYASDMLCAWKRIPAIAHSLISALWILIKEIADTILLSATCIFAILVFVLAPFFFWLAPIIAFFHVKKLKKKETYTDIWGDVCEHPQQYLDKESK